MVILQNITAYYLRDFFLLLYIFYVYLLAENKSIITFNRRTWQAFSYHQQRTKAFKNA